MATTMEHWICNELSNLGVDVTEENARYIIAMEGDQDIEDYLFDLLDKSDPKVQTFVSQLLKQRKKSKRNDKGQKSTESLIPKVYQKMESGPDYFQGTTKKQGKNDKSKMSKKGSKENVDFEHQSKSETNSKSAKESSKKKAKYVPLYSKEGQARTVVKIPGRHTCDCQALKHELVNNCLECGRIVCAQEGAGVCLFCGNLVCTKEQQRILAEGTKKSEKLRQTLMKDSDKVLQQINNQILQISKNSANNANSEEISKAVEYKNRLLDYDKTSVKRTHVIDDDADYFSSDSQWLSKSEREALERREEAMREIRFRSSREIKVTFDFAGRRIVDEEEKDGFSVNNMYEDQKAAVQEEARRIHLNANKDVKSTDRDLVNPAINMNIPKYIEPENSEATQSPLLNIDSGKRMAIRLQDKEIQEMHDEGFCLSMHQPWASLLVSGIKIHEGRTWYTPHRGKLWIASTAQIPDKEDINQIEMSYRQMYKGKDLKFPNTYPPGTLLGSVELVDCLEREEYLTKFPDGESGCPYVFICENPQELFLKFPVSGKHKIYKLRSDIHQAAKKGLKKSIQYNAVKRTYVIDDDADYFSSDSQWLSKSEREALERREEAMCEIRFRFSREINVTFDFVGCRIVDEEEKDGFSVNNMYEDQKAAVQEEARRIHLNANKDVKSTDRDLVNPAINMNIPKYIEPENSEATQSPLLNIDSGKRMAIRLQDKEIQEMHDEGFCLSMHQPWASLLVSGIKIHEGRTWYTPHRGKLWIASTAQIPDKEDINQIEMSYRQMYKGKDLKFPNTYPPGTLLGSVELVDCLEREEYLTKFPDGESGCPYVFICENPQELFLKFPVSGKHKIYKLRSDIHQAAKKGLKKSIQYNA